MPRQAVATLLNLSAAPIHGAPSTCVLLAITNVPEIAAVFDWRSALKLSGPQLVFDVPMRVPVTGWVAKGTLQRCHRAINGALAPTWHAAESVLSGMTKGDPVRWG